MTDKVEKMIKVYSISFVERLPLGVGLVFAITKSKEEMVKNFVFAVKEMKPGEDVVKVSMAEMKEIEFDALRLILKKEKGQFKNKQIKGKGGVA